MMDGLAGMKLMASLFSPTPDVEPPPATARRASGRLPSRFALLAGAVPWLARQPWRAARAGARSARSLLHRTQLGRGEPEVPAPVVSRSWLNVEITPQRAVAYTSLALAELRAVGEPFGASVTDVLLALVAGALRRYLAARGVEPEAPLVAGVPVAMRGKGDERANAVTSTFVSLATDLADPVARLLRIRDAMAARKRARGRSLGEDLAAWADVPPPLVFSWLSEAYLDLHLAERIDPLCNLVVSSVPGPQQPLHLAGARLVGIHPLGPIYSGIALNVTAIGHADRLDIGLVACRGRMPDLWDLADAIPLALGDLADTAGADVAVARVGMPRG
jgi:WS/DGAT/MGAT family acyltransferase